jgi:signal transduction histidine kinase
MLSRAERGKLNVETSDINVHELLTTLGDNYSAEATAKGLQLHVDAAKSLELLHSSELYVREIIQNFITNSIKYTQKGSVTMTAKPQDDGVLFTVSDTGIGISKGDQEKVFDKFFRSEDFRTRETGGTGLGLYVTAKLANLLHAKITLDSELNKGSTFSIYIPNLQKEVRRPKQKLD